MITKRAGDALVSKQTHLESSASTKQFNAISGKIIYNY